MAKAKSLGISSNVKFLGFRNDVDKILKESTAFVSLSPFENSTDLALLEAMSIGVPVVVTDVWEIKKIMN